MRQARFIPFVLLSLALGACAAAPEPVAGTVGDGRQVVQVSTPGVMGAACTVQTRSGSYVVMSPGRFSVAPSPSPLNISCTKGEHFAGRSLVPARQVAQSGVYTYPGSVAVPMELNNRSLKTAGITVF